MNYTRSDHAAYRNQLMPIKESHNRHTLRVITIAAMAIITCLAILSTVQPIPPTQCTQDTLQAGYYGITNICK